MLLHIALCTSHTYDHWEPEPQSCYGCVYEISNGANTPPGGTTAASFAVILRARLTDSLATCVFWTHIGLWLIHKLDSAIRNILYRVALSAINPRSTAGFLVITKAILYFETSSGAELSCLTRNLQTVKHCQSLWSTPCSQMAKYRYVLGHLRTQWWLNCYAYGTGN